MQVMHCPKPECGYASFCNRFCVKCGSPMQKGGLRPALNTKCPECNTGGVLLEDEFCGSCGCKIPPRHFIFFFKDTQSFFGCSFVVADNWQEAKAALDKAMAGRDRQARFAFHKVIELRDYPEKSKGE